MAISRPSIDPGRGLPIFPGRGEAPRSSDRLRTLGVSLRRATAADLPFLDTLYAAFRAVELALVPWTPEQKRRFLTDQFRLQHVHFTRFYPNADFWLVERPYAHPVGRLYLDRSPPLWRIVDIGLLSAARGQGLGGALLRSLQDAAQGARAAGIDLHVARDNRRAAALYERLGFEEIESEIPTHRRMAWHRDV